MYDRDGFLIAEGVRFDDKVCIRWCTHDKPSSIVIWDSLNDFKQISVSSYGRKLLEYNIDEYIKTVKQQDAVKFAQDCLNIHAEMVEKFRKN